MNSTSTLTLLTLLALSACATHVGSTSGAQEAEETWRGVTAGAGHACAIRMGDDRAVCWGLDDDGQVSKTPKVPFASLSAGPSYTCGIERDSQRLRCWGLSDDEWQPSVVSRTPKGGAWRAVYAAEFRACGIREPDGALTCWGTGDGGVELNPAEALFDGAPMRAAWVGSRMVCGLRADSGEAVCDVFEAPKQPLVALGEACGLTAEGQLLCWGSDPMQATMPSEPMAALGTGNDFTPCALRAEDRRPVCWSEPEGWLDGAPAVGLQELAVGWGFVCGVGEGGSPLMCWGKAVRENPELAEVP